MVLLNPHLRQNYSILRGISSKISINYQIIMYNFQIETSFVNLNPIARNPGSAPASTIYFIYMGQPIWNPVALPIWVPYRLLAGYEKFFIMEILKLKVGIFQR